MTNKPETVTKLEAQGTTRGSADCSPAQCSASLSKADEDALTRLPDGRWFKLYEVPFMVRNPRWRCDRLTAKGVLKSRVVKHKMFNGFGYETQWRKTPNAAAHRKPPGE